MSYYEVGSVVQFVRSLTRTNFERVINIDEKGRIFEISGNGIYSVQLLDNETPITGVSEADIQPSIEQPGDVLPGESDEHDVNSPAHVQDTK